MKRLIKFLAFCIIICILFSFAVASVSAASSGSCGDNLTWILDDNGTLTISGSGAMKCNYPEFSVPWYSLRSSIKNVVIQNGVTSIDDYAFSSCKNLSQVVVGDDVISIGKYSFANCNNLIQATINEGLINIGDSAFQNCYALKSIDIPKSVESIGDSAFYYCGLISIAIPESVKNIGSFAFSSCKGLEQITIGDGVKSIGYSVFENTAYYRNDDNWEDDILYIGNCLIRAKNNVTSVDIKSGTRILADRAFFGCGGIENIAIPNDVTNIGKLVFNSCSSLMSITVSENNQNYSSLDGILFNKNKTELVRCPGGKTGVYLMPDGVKSVSDGAFYLCSNLTGITISNSVIDIGESAFRDCSGLKSIIIPDSVEYIGDYAFASCRCVTQVQIGSGVTDIGDHLFAWCSSITSIIVPDSVVNIGDQAFWSCDNLTSVMLGRNVISIGYDAFYSCRKLTLIDIPKSVINIAYQAFGDCISLTDVYYGGSVDNWEDVAILEGNDYLKNSNIHFAEELLTESITFDTSTVLRVTPKNAKIGDAVIVSAYKGGAVTDIKEMQYGGETLEFTIASDYDSIKIMLWDSLVGMEPLAPAKSE